MMRKSLTFSTPTDMALWLRNSGATFLPVARNKAQGFLCNVETDWMQMIIHNALKPVMKIKPLAAGRLMAPTGLGFVWSTIRDCDIVTLGTMSTYEAEECIEISLACLERQDANVELQFTRSKRTLVSERYPQ